MGEVFRAVLAVHVAAGIAAIGLFWAALAQRKGSPRHRRLGRCYVRAMWVMLATALGLAGLAAAVPGAIHPPAPGLAASALADHVAGVRAFALFLGAIAMMTGGFLWFGDRAVRGPRARGVRAPVADVAVALLLLAIGIAGIRERIDGGPGVTVVGTLLLVALLRRPSPRACLRAHITGIVLSATSAHTAFAVSVVPRIVPGIYERDPAVQILPWTLPGVVGLIGLAYALRRWGHGPRPPAAAGGFATNAPLRRA